MNTNHRRLAALVGLTAIGAVAVVVLVLQGDDQTAATDEVTVPTPAPLPSDLPSGLSGTWSGTFVIATSDASAGTLSVELVQQGEQLTGSISVEGATCFSGGGFQGLVDGTDVEFSVLQRDEVEFVGSIDARSMSGTVDIACDNSVGTWTLDRQP